jgi:hypothetical protein
MDLVPSHPGAHVNCRNAELREALSLWKDPIVPL